MSNIVRVLVENIFILILCILMAACTAVILMKKQAAMLKITRTDFGEGVDKIHFVHLSDLHIPLLPISLNKICGVIIDERPSFIVITGDLCKRQFEGRLESFLYMLSKAECPIYITFGNHDNALFAGDMTHKKSFIANMESISPYIRVLENDYVIYKDGDRKLVIGGLCDYRDDISYGSDKSKCVNSLIKEWGSVSKRMNADLIIASHNPDIMLYVNEKLADLFLFGHTHGGQIWLPFNLEFILLRRDKLPQKHYIYGRYEYMNNQIYITCGVGCTVVPLRFRSSPEICVHSI